jgi:lipopolysaccharide transport system permease protein
MRLLRGHFQAFSEIVNLLTRYRDLTFEMARREISDRYAGQAFGIFWAVGHPVFMIGLYIFIFSFVFRQKIGGTVDLPLDYTSYILSGMVAWLGFQESMIKSCSAITSNSSLVKQVVFPLEILPVKGVLASFFPQMVSLLILIAYVLITNGGLLLTYALLPVLMVLQLMAMIGVAYILSAFSAYIRDTKDFVQLYATAGVYLLPVFYLPAWVPQIFKPLIYFNPFSYMVWCYQDALFYGRIEHPLAWVVNIAISTLIFIVGYRTFRKLKQQFGTVL